MKQNEAQKYISDVLTGKIVVGEYIRKAVERHMDDLENAEERGIYFDAEHASKIIEVFKNIPHAKGQILGQNFTLQGWQAFILWSVYGWKWTKTQTRRFSKIYIKVARKNGKTEFLAGVGVLGMTIDAISTGEIYWAATKYAQAEIGWERQKTMIELLMSRFDVFKQFGTNSKRIYNRKNRMFARALGKDSKREDGLSPYYAIIDEYHAHPDTGLIDILESGMGAYKQPLTWIITTAGFDVFCVCKDFEDRCKAILDGHASNNEIFSMIFDLDEGDDWENPETWVKSNPSLGVSNSLRKMMSEYQKAKLEGVSKEISFRVKNLNQWHNSKTTWIKLDTWKQNGIKIPDSELKGRPCYAGLDLGSVSDVSALVLCFPFPEEGFFYFKHFFYVPSSTAKVRSMGSNVNYLQWHRDGWLTITDGAATDYDYIFEDLKRINTDYELIILAYDRFNSSQLIINITTETDIKAQPYGQGFRSMSSPASEMERLTLLGQWKHDENPMMTWMVGNVALRMDAAGNIKPDKDKSKDKIDGVVAQCFAFGAYQILKKDPPKTLPSDFKIVFG